MLVIETLMVTCAGCGRAFPAPLQVDRATLEALVLSENYVCPHCDLASVYVKADHFHRMELAPGDSPYGDNTTAPRPVATTPERMTDTPAHAVRIGTRSYPVVLPRLSDPRLHLAAVIISIHVLGQVALGFRVSVPQILVAILTCGLIEVVVEFVRSRRLVWPASAMLTGSGVALILRVVGTGRSDHWSWNGWHLFALVAGFSLISKYVIRRRGSHIFNPSNFGLVVAFLVLGGDLIEPLDFWWAPMGPGMVAAYAVILVGGVLITRRLDLLRMAAVFWIGFAGLLALMTAPGHCMTTAWALEPVCGTSFWWVVVTSPEVLIFLFFMLTDPRTIPTGRLARAGFAGSVALLSALLIAPQANEYGAKVGLLAGLVLLTPLAILYDRLLPEGRRLGDILLPPNLVRRMVVFGRGALMGASLAVMAILLVVAGLPARPKAAASAPVQPAEVDVTVDTGALPVATVSTEAAALNSAAADDPSQIAAALANDLAVEAVAMRRAETSLLRGADDGPRLIEMERAIEAAATADRLAVANYSFERLYLDVRYVNGPQGGASLALEAAGTVELVVYDAADSELSRSVDAFETTFVLRPASDGGWLIWTTE